jgi:hypothetical protein
VFIICKSVVWLLFSSSNETVRSHSSRILQLEFPSSNHWQFQDGELPNQMMMKFKTKEVLIRKRFVIFWWSSLRFKHLHFVTERLLFHSICRNAQTQQSGSISKRNVSLHATSLQLKYSTSNFLSNQMSQQIIKVWEYADHSKVFNRWLVVWSAVEWSKMEK